MSGATTTVPRPAAERVGPGEALVLLLAGLLPIAASPQVYASFWAPKAALLLPAVVPGLVSLGGACVARDRAAWAAAAFVGAGGLAAVLAPAPLLALLGLHNLGTGWLFVAACVGLWALGRGLGARAREVLVVVLLVAALLEAAVAWLQMALPLGTELLEPFEGRAGALLGNPVHVASFMVAALALGSARLAAARRPAVVVGGLAAVAFLAGAVELSGGRTGLLLLGVLAVWLAVRHGARLAVAFVVAALLGAGAAGLVEGDGSVNATRRLQVDAAAGLAGRADRWALALPAVAERPVLGFGPGQFRRATSPRTTAAAARAFGPDTLSEDAHNLFVEYLTTTGVLGVLLLSVWLALAGVRARGPLASFAVFGGLALLVQPQTVGLTPVLALALGAAAPRIVAARGRGATAVSAGGALVGVLLAVLLLRGEWLLARSADESSVGPARAAVGALPPWPVARTLEARALEFRAISRRDRSAREAALVARREAVGRDPSDPRLWNDLGSTEAAWGSPGAAETAFREANRRNPWSVQALRSRAKLARARGQSAEVAQLCRRVREVAPRSTCPGPEGARKP